LLKRLISAIAMTSVIAGVVAVASVVPAQAAGGGCNTTTQNGWNVGACSWDNGVDVYGDLYINWPGSSVNCIVYYQLIDLTSGARSTLKADLPCYVGWHGSSRMSKIPGHRYVHRVSVVQNGVTKWSGDSKVTT
jgi:hypothetical protein